MNNVDNFFEVIDTRKTVRQFLDEDIKNEDIKRMIESARLAPSAVNAQNWKFIAIKNTEIKEKLANAVSDKYDEIIKKLDDENIKAQVNRFREHSTFFKSAPLLVVAIETKHPAFLDGVLEHANYTEEEIKLMRPDSQLLSMGGAVENIILSAQALGLHSCWMVAPIIAYKKFAEILNLDKDEKIVSLLAIGKPANNNSNRVHKKSLDEIIKIIS